MKLYNFIRLITKYSCDFTVSVKERGEYSGGIYQAGEDERIDMRGAVVPMSERKIYQSGGHYTTQDRDLYMKIPIPYPLEDCRVLYQGDWYTVEEGTEYSEYADAWEYVMRRVSAFD